jgi:hypothetical protein
MWTKSASPIIFKLNSADFFSLLGRIANWGKMIRGATNIGAFKVVNLFSVHQLLLQKFPTCNLAETKILLRKDSGSIKNKFISIASFPRLIPNDSHLPHFSLYSVRCFYEPLIELESDKSSTSASTCR